MAFSSTRSTYRPFVISLVLRLASCSSTTCCDINSPIIQDNVFFLGQTYKFLQVSWLADLFCTWSKEFPDATFIRYLNFANVETLVVNNIEAYKEILQTKAQYFVKPYFARTFAFQFIGDGLPFVEGNLHKLRRAMLLSESRDDLAYRVFLLIQ